MINMQEWDRLSAKLGNYRGLRAEDKKFVLRDLENFIDKTDAKDPQKLLSKGEGLGGYRNADFATIIMRIALTLDKDNIPGVFEQLKAHGAKPVAFGDAFVMLQKFNFLHVAHADLLRDYAQNQYTLELYNKMHERNEYIASNPFLQQDFEVALNGGARSHKDVSGLEKLGIDLGEMLKIDTSERTMLYAENRRKPINIKCKDGYVNMSLGTVQELQPLIKKYLLNKSSQKIQNNMATMNQYMANQKQND